ncbi:RE1 [Symbiodinium sp. CCMP2592]|nr:RE1 [Symbiodinium sp. CCMP2592]
MSPSGDAAQVPGQGRVRVSLPNGVTPRVGGALEEDADYVQALRASGLGATRANTGHGTADEAVTGARPDRGEAEGVPALVDARNDEVFQSPTTEQREQDRPLLPHAAVNPGSGPEALPSGISGSLFPSPMPSPLTQSMPGTDSPSVSGGLNLAQHGANAVRWFSRLGEYVQRRVAQQSRPGVETTLVQETIWSPGGSTRRTSGGMAENQPLFDHGQARRLREMTLAAPQLYGATSQRAAGSDSSASYTREQMEMEVKRQVEQAMQSQRVLSDENQRSEALRRSLLRAESVYPKAIHPDFLDTVVSRRVKGLRGLSHQDCSRVWEGLVNRMQGGDQRVLRAYMEFCEETPRAKTVVEMSAELQGPGATANQGVIFPSYLDALGVLSGKMAMVITAYLVAILWDYQYATVNPEAILLERDLVKGEGGSVPQGPGASLQDPGPGGERDEGTQGIIQMEALLKGMTQLQAAMTMQLGMAATKPETIRPGTSGAELPKLTEADEYAAINVGDWLHGLSGPMGDLTDRSATWWTETMRCLDCFYQQFVTASAVKKLQLKAEDFMSPQLMQGDENRVVSESVWKALESPGTAGSTADLVEALRKWARWLKRAQDLSLQVPDASILLRGLDAAARGQLTQHHEVNFRTNVLRYSLDLDAAPTLATVMKYHSHLLGEFEQLTYRGRGKGPGPSMPVVKNVNVASGDIGGGGTQKGGASPQSPGGGRPCKFYLSETGCQRSNCKYAHDWNAIPKEERAERCKGCGGKGHMRKNCPLKSTGNDGPRRGDDGKGGAGPRVRSATTTGTAPGDGKRDDGTLPQVPPATSSTPSGSASMGASAAQSGSTASATSTATNKDMDEFLKSAAQVLKMMTEQQGGAGQPSPSMKMLKRAVMKYEQKMALVDSGATHPLRKATTVEWTESPEVDVVVAGDGTARMKQNRSGTLLTQPTTTQTSSQTILPVGSLVNVLGYELRWCKRKCILRAPDGKEIPLKTTSGCPEVDEAKALELIAEIEQENLHRLQRETETTRVAMLRANEVCADEQWEKSMKRYVAEGLFEHGFRYLASAPWLHDVPRENLIKVVTDLPKDLNEAWQLMMHLGFNRRMRKRLVHKDWLVKLFSGRGDPQDKAFKAAENNGAMTLDVDVQRMSTLDLRSQGPGIMKLLLYVGSGHGKDRFGDWWDPSYKYRGTFDKAEEDETARVWQLDWFRRWIETQNLEVIHFEQGGLGHPVRKPTAMITNLDVSELRGVKDLRLNVSEKTMAWASWAPFLTRMLKALRAVDRKAWERHLANDHTPYRADCLQCIHNATGRPHRRCLHRDCYVLSADVLGPVRVAGPKGERHAIVFTYQFPKQHLAPEDQPVPEEDLVGWNLDAKETKPEAPPEEEEYSPDEGPDPELSREELDELRRVQAEVVEFPEEEFSGVRKVKVGKDAESKEDWWEFHEATGVLVRHHVAARDKLFRPTSWNGCPVDPAKLEPTRITDIQYVGGGVEMETSDWHGPQSGARKLPRMWTGRTTFKISAAEEPEEEDLMKKDEETWEKIIGDLTQPVEMDTIYMVYPVRARRGGDAMLAIQEASEFASKGLRKWLLDHDIYHTRSEALVPQTNGAAERGVRWFKTRAKVLLDEAKVATKYWTLAMQHAANRRIYERLGLHRPELLRFGAEVLVRRKVFGNNKKYDLTDRWEKGTYLGLSDSIKGGSIVLRPNGLLTETLNLKTKVVDPHVVLQEPEVPGDDDGGGVGDVDAELVPVLDLPIPDHRLKGKQPPPEIRKMEASNDDGCKKVPSGWTRRSMVRAQEEKALHLYNHSKFDEDSCAELLSEINLTGKMRTKSRGTSSSSAMLGAYVHGGLRGVTVAMRKRPALTKYLNMVLRMRAAENLSHDVSWTTLGVFKAADIPPHRDLRNQPNTLNYVTEIGVRDAGGLWVAKQDGRTGCEGGGKITEHNRELPDGNLVEGDLVKISGCAVAFDPRVVHSYVNKETDRWIVAGFTPLGVENLKPEAVPQLLKGGFPLEGSSVSLEGVDVEDYEDTESSMDSDPSSQDEEEVEDKARVLRCALEQDECMRKEAEHRDQHALYLETLLEEFTKEIQYKERKKMRKIMKMVPGAAANVEVEQLLSELHGPLEVVHNVGLPEVKKYLPKWKGAIKKEVKALVDSGTIRRLTPAEARDLRQKGLIVLPGKGVFTVKPPLEAKELGADMYRRKCRVVVCGNYLPQSGTEVYASGTSADSLRFSIAYAVYRGWGAGGTDISNAFTLAPMPGELLYGLQPPTVVLQAEEAQPGELWLIQRVLYGLREAPRLWSVFRNDRFLHARVPHGDEVLMLKCMETDENVWLIRGEQDSKIYGMMIVYVDDILFLSSNDIIRSMYKWLTDGWKCTALEMLDDGPIRFLGMELRKWRDGIHVSQSGYIRDLLRQQGVCESNQGLTVPCAREWLQDEDSDEEKKVPEEFLVKAAQKATGETLWLSTRSRPELAHSVACMAARALNQPQKALEIHKRVMLYLSRTVEYGIYFYHDDTEPMLTVYSDASYAPGGGRSFGCILAQVAGTPVAWRASKQPVITLSVAEAELYEGISAVQLGLGFEAMLHELGEAPVMVLKIDNQAAQGLASEAPGSWKTRHLRIRARFLRQEVSAQRLHVMHVPGELQKADLGTKAFDLPKFRSLMALWRMLPWSTEDVGKADLKSIAAINMKKPLMFVLMCLVMIQSAEAAKEDLQLDGSLEFYAVTVLVVVAAVAVWELLKRVCRGMSRWWTSSRKKRERMERLRNRAQAAVQEEIRRYEPRADSPLATTRRSSTSSTTRRTPMSPAPTISTSTGVHMRSISTQTDPGPAMIPANRLAAYNGPFYVTTHGDRVHLTSYCHGQRNAAAASKRFELCHYCDRARGLYVLTAPDED